MIRKLNLTTRTFQQDLEDMLEAGIYIKPLTEEEMNIAIKNAKRILKQLRRIR